MLADVACERRGAKNLAKGDITLALLLFDAEGLSLWVFMLAVCLEYYGATWVVEVAW